MTNSVSNPQSSTAPEAGRRPSFPFIEKMIAGLLLLAAAAKLYRIYRVGPSANPLESYTDVFLNLTLGLWFASAFGRAWANRVAFGVFLIFIAVTWSTIHHARTSCGCFGDIPISPRWVYFLDATILSALTAQQDWLLGRNRTLRLSASIVVILAAIGAFGLAYPKAVRSQPPPSPPTESLEPDYVAKPLSGTEWLADLGESSGGRTLQILFNLTNPTNHDLGIRGVNISCGCTSLPKPCQVIPKNGQTPVMLIVRLPERPGEFDSKASLTTDSPQLPPLTLEVRVEIN